MIHWDSSLLVFIFCHHSSSFWHFFFFIVQKKKSPVSDHIIYLWVDVGLLSLSLALSWCPSFTYAILYNKVYILLVFVLPPLCRCSQWDVLTGISPEVSTQSIMRALVNTLQEAPDYITSTQQAAPLIPFMWPSVHDSCRIHLTSPPSLFCPFFWRHI